MKKTIAISAIVIFSIIVIGAALYASGFNPFKTENSVPSTFDPTALEQRIGPENSVQMTLGEYFKTAPPAWNEQDKTLAIPLPVIRKSNQASPLHVEKSNNIINGKLDEITIDGLSEGDELFYPFDTDGEIVIYQGAENLATFSLRTKNSEGEDEILYFDTTGLTPLIKFESPITAPEQEISRTIKKGDLIGPLLTNLDRQRTLKGWVKITGMAPLLKKFNLAAFQNKAVEITE